MRPFLYWDVLKGEIQVSFKSFLSGKPSGNAFSCLSFPPSVSWPTISDVYPGMQGSAWGLGKTPYHRYIRMKVYFLRMGVRNRSVNEGLSFSVMSSSTDSIYERVRASATSRLPL